jgi:hypothetical protein
MEVGVLRYWRSLNGSSTMGPIGGGAVPCLQWASLGPGLHCISASESSAPLSDPSSAPFSESSSAPLSELSSESGGGGRRVLGLIRRCQQRFGVWIRRTILLLVLLVLCVMLGHGIRSRFALPDLHAWHTTRLVSEYRASDNDRPSNLAEYLALEGRLFAELDEKILRNPSAEDTSYVSRYNPRTGAAAIARDTPYNRTFELRPKEGPPRGAALLLHGLTDSPYSWRATALELQEAGFYVLALRLPGHGTIPSGLLDVTAEDWKAAVAMASRHVATQIPADRPFWIGGYSTGGTLALVHALDVVERTGENSSGVLRRPDRILLMSPAVGVSEFAVLSDLLSSVAVIPAFR